jgi:hypothetical protein
MHDWDISASVEGTTLPVSSFFLFVRERQHVAIVRWTIECAGK